MKSEFNRRSAWPIVVAASLTAGSAFAVMLDAKDGTRLARAFKAERPGWEATPAGYGGAADGNWSYALAGRGSWKDYRVTASVNLAQAANRTDGMEMGCFAVYEALAKLGGYEAAVIVRHESLQRHYRVAVSTLWKEVVLWRPTGGIVQVAPFPFETNKTYTITVECQGPRILVAVDGKPVMDWWDTVDPITQGQVGIGMKEGESHFTAVKVESVKSDGNPAPAHQARFREQKWHNMRWYFDGNEPLFCLLDSNVMDNMKLRPGFRAVLYAFNYITDWSRFYPAKITSYKLVQEGDRLIFETQAIDEKTKTSITCDARLVVTYDPQRRVYDYDHTCTTHIPDAAEAAKVAPGWDHGDSVFLGGVGWARTRDPNCPRSTYQWSVWEHPDGKLYKVPLNHNGHYDGTDTLNGGSIKPDGGVVAILGDPLLGMVIRIPGLASSFGDISYGHCGWAYDIHTMFSPKKVDGKILPGDYVSRVIYTGMEPKEAQDRLARAGFYKARNLNIRIPVFTAGIGMTEPFDKAVVLASPHQEWRIWAGAIDDTVGHGDHSSLRLDGPTEAWTLTGGSYFTGGYGRTNRFTAWVKTRDAQGEGPAFGMRRVDNKYEFHTTGITGTTDWQKISYVTTFPGDSYGVHLYWRNSGLGTVWVDDFKVEPLDGQAGIETTPPRDYPVQAANPDIVLKWEGKGSTNGVLDLSGFGHHGRIYGNAAWAENNGRQVLVLDGKTSYVWPLSSPNLTLGPDTTMIFDIKPEAGGYLLDMGFTFRYSLDGAPKMSLYYQRSGEQQVASQPIVETGAWQRLAIVVRQGKILLYVNGTPAGELAAKTVHGDPSLHTGSTWHRHLSFFGAAQGDMGLLPEDGGGHMKGQVRSVTVYRKALSADAIAGLPP